MNINQQQSFIKIILIFSAMGKFMKPGKVVLVLSGRFAGRKAVIVKVSDLIKVIICPTQV